MSSPRRRGRRIPSKSRPPRPSGQPAPTFDTETPDEAGGEAELEPTGTRPTSRAANRAAKRAAYGVRPKAVGRGRVTGRRQSNIGLIALAIGAVVIAVAVIALGNPFGGPAASASPSVAASAAGATYGNGTCPTSQPAGLAAGESRLVTIETSKGTIVIRVDGALSPIATGNFVALAECEYYDGVVFHRLVPGFVIQGGDPDGTGSGPGPGYGIQDEPITGTYKRGTVAMARTELPNSQGSQFFIVLADGAATALTNVDPARGYAILGEVISGMDVVDTIAAMPNSGEGGGNAALEPVAMTRVTVSTAPAASASPVPSGASPAPSASPAAPSASAAAPAASPATTT